MFSLQRYSLKQTLFLFVFFSSSKTIVGKEWIAKLTRGPICSKWDIFQAGKLKTTSMSLLWTRNRDKNQL